MIKKWLERTIFISNHSLVQVFNICIAIQIIARLLPYSLTQGYKPRNSRVCKIRLQATMKVAVRKLTF